MNNKITNLLDNNTFSGLVAVLLIALITILGNKPDLDLEKRVSELEKRVDLIEENMSGANKVDASDEEKPYRENWRKLREGMSQDKVQELLGRPDRVDGGSMTVWHYPRMGRIYFIRGKLDSWSEPF